MTKITQSVLLFTLLAASGAAWGETYYQQVNDDSGSTSFTGASWAVDSSGTTQNIAEIIASDPDAVFVTARGTGSQYLLRTPTNGDQTFPGKCLQLGDSNKGGTLLLKMGRGNSLTVTNLTLVAGAMANGDSGEQTLLSENTIKVQSTADHPFRFTGGQGRGINVSGGLSSEDDNALLVVDRYSLIKTGSGSSGELSGSFTCTLAGDNKGYNGKWAVDNLNMYGIPTTGLAANAYVSLSIDSADRLGANPETLVTDTVTLKNNGTLAMTGDTLALDNRGLTIDATGGRITRTGDLTISGTISGEGTLDLSGITGTITLDATISGSVSVAIGTKALNTVNFGSNFSWSTTGPFTRNDTEYTVPYVYLKTSMEAKTSYTNPSFWSDNAAASSSYDYYVISGLVMRTTTNWTPACTAAAPETFPGKSLTLVGAADTSRAKIIQKCRCFKVTNLTLGDFSQYQFGGDNNSGQVLTADSTVTITASSGNKAQIDGGDANRESTLGASLSGSGSVAFQKAKSITLTGDNSAFTGEMHLYGDATLKVSNGNQFGGNPASELENGLQLYGTLQITDDATVSQPHRGFYVAGSGTRTISVASDKTFSWSGPFAVPSGSALTKSGDGVLALAGKVAANGTITVSAGSLVFKSGSTLSGGGAITGAVSAEAGATLSFTADDAITFDSSADLTNFSLSTAGLDTATSYTVAKGTTSLPTLTTAQQFAGWSVTADTENTQVVLAYSSTSRTVTLSEETDWPDETVEVADNGSLSVDLAGHSLTIGALTLGTGASLTFSSSAAAKVYATGTAEEKAWITSATFGENVMLVIEGEAIDLSSLVAPGGGIGFRNTSGEQHIYVANCANGLALLGNATVKETTDNNMEWKDATPTFTITVSGESNAIKTNGGRYSSAIKEFFTTPLAGDGELTIDPEGDNSFVNLYNASTADFTGTITIKADNFDTTEYNRSSDLHYQQNSNGIVVFQNDVSAMGNYGKRFYLTDTIHYYSAVTFVYDGLATTGTHPENIIVGASFLPDSNDTVKNNSFLQVGGVDWTGTFGGVFTNVTYTATYVNGQQQMLTTTQPLAIKKVGTGTWTLSGKVSNGGNFTVEGGEVVFDGEVSNLATLTVNSGATATLGEHLTSFVPTTLALAGGTLKGEGNASCEVSVSVASTITAESGKTLTIAATSVNFEDGATIAKAGNGTVLFKGVAKSALEGHLADGTYAKQVVGGVELTKTEPAVKGITIIIAEGGSETTIDLDSSDALYTWIPVANRTDATAISKYLKEDGTGGINGLKAFLLGYESVPTTAPQLAATATSEGWTFTFDGNEPRTLDGVKVTYKMQGRATASAEWADISDATAENGAITLPLASAMLFNRLVADIAAE